jgi:hypothetical protein
MAPSSKTTSPACVGCGQRAPETETHYSLISAKFGWRLRRFRTPSGKLAFEWRCSACWRTLKARSQGGSEAQEVEQSLATPDLRDGRREGSG